MAEEEVLQPVCPSCGAVLRAGSYVCWLCKAAKPALRSEALTPHVAKAVKQREDELDSGPSQARSPTRIVQWIAIFTIAAVVLTVGVDFARDNPGLAILLVLAAGPAFVAVMSIQRASKTRTAGSVVLAVLSSVIFVATGLFLVAVACVVAAVVALFTICTKL
jgi:hypothetical protein